jgi:hypothetical protein
VVAEDREHRDAETAACVGEDDRLLGLAVGGQVAGQQDEVGLAAQRGERRADLVVLRLTAMDVARGGDPDGGRRRVDGPRCTPAAAG